MSKKRAFTMVELIFVIVILGILAAVAVPRLNASREDAEAAALKANIKTLINDLDSYLLANGEFEEKYNPEKYTSVALEHYKYDAAHSANFLKTGDVYCLGVDIERVDSYVLVVKPPLARKSAACKKVLCDEQMRALLTGYASGSTTVKKELMSAAVCAQFDTHEAHTYAYRRFLSGVNFD